MRELMSWIEGAGGAKKYLVARNSPGLRKTPTNNRSVIPYVADKAFHGLMTL
ncbi:MAG: hypothetical protein ACJ8G8_12210 [Pseudomonas sp.]|jgi:hypothetical protein